MPTVTKSGTTSSATPVFNPLAISGCQLWLSTRYPETMITDGAAKFSNNQYLTIANNSTLQTGHTNWWISFWVNGTQTQTNNWCRVISRVNGWQAAANTEFYIGGYNFSSAYNINLYISDGTTLVNNAYQYFTKDVWNHIFCWYNPSTKRGYMMSPNGNIAPTGVLPNNMQTGNYSFDVGNPPVTCDYSLDSVAFGKSSTNLGDGSAGSLAKTIRDYLYNSGSGRIYSSLSSQQKTDWGLVSWWDLNESTGTRKDSHGSNNLTASASSPTVANGIVSGRATYTGDVISQWSDLSGNNRHVTQSTASQKPTLQLAAQNGLPGVLSDGVDDFLTQASSTATFNFLHASQGSVFVVTKPANVADSVKQSHLLGTNGGASANIGYWFLVDDLSKNQAVRSFITNGASGSPSVNNQSSADLVILNNYQILSEIIDNANATVGNRSEIRINGGAPIKNNAAATAPSSSNASFDLQLFSAGNNYVSTVPIVLCEVLIFNQKLTDSQRQYIERGLAQAYNLPVSNITPLRCYYGGDPGLGLNENWNLAYSFLPIKTVQGLIHQ